MTQLVVRTKPNLRAAPVPSGKVGGPSPADAARAPRTRRALIITARSSTGENLVVLRNVSATGLGGSSEQPFNAGQYLDIELPGIGTVASIVRWSDGRRFGARFVDSINHAALHRTG